MDWPVIHKAAPRSGVMPNLTDYARACTLFSWEQARQELGGLPGGGLNIAHAAVTRHAVGERADHPALRFVHRDQTTKTLTYRQLDEDTSRFANVLHGLGVSSGERVFTLLGRRPELHTAMLGALKSRNVVCPLFSAFGPEPLRQRLQLGEAVVLVTTSSLYSRKIAPMRADLPRLRVVLLVDENTEDEGLHSLPGLMAAASPDFRIPPTDPEDPALLHFTSGTTGTPKGAVHVHEAVVSHYVTGGSALDLHPEDVFWCTADPGWVTGTAYGVIAPLVHGVTVVVDEEEFDAPRWYSILADHGVTVWYTAPTALRMLMKAGNELAARHDLSRLRFVASVGEPLNPEVVVWGERAFGLPVHDNWWQTETGGIMIANLPAMDIRPGSMGRPLPGVEAAIVAQDERGAAVLDPSGRAEFVTAPGTNGILALRAGWPSMFRAYLHDDARYRACFAGGWYLSGDVVREDSDGYFWFVGRGDDVIKSAGHLIGPFEVESALMEHPAVVQAGVIGKPDPVAGQVVKAFVELREPYEPSEELRLELLGFSRKRLGAAVAPREIEFATALPRTRSGKIVRRLLRAHELGLAEGDLSTLENGGQGEPIGASS